MRRLLAELHVILSRFSSNSILALVLALVALLGWLDYATGFEITFSTFYLIPIAISTWYINVQTGHAITFLSIGIWIVSNRLAGQVYSNEIVGYWNASVRFIIFYSIASLVSEFKIVLEHERRLSRTDDLTGVNNRREFFYQAELELKRASRQHYPLSAAYIDLDSFKEMNDELGHREGDKLLQAIATTIASNIRQTDQFARLGGDEFILLLSNTSQETARAILQKLESAIRQELKTMGAPVTVSLGVSTFLSAPRTVDELIHKTDVLLYKAKSQGKNQALYVQYD